MSQREIIEDRRLRRQRRVRKKLGGTAERPRLCVFRSSKHIYVQVVNDTLGKTLVSAGTIEPDVRKDVPKKGATKPRRRRSAA